MKKIVGTIAAIALAASSAFAGVNVGMGFNRGFFTPIAYDGNDAMADISTSWGASPRIGVSFSAGSEDVGVVADVKFDSGNVAVNDNAYIWVKPISWLKLQIGQSFDDTLRGNACFGSWDWLRPGNIVGEDVVFTRVCSNPLDGAYAPVQGAIVALDPIEGLHLSVALNTPYAHNDAPYWDGYVPQTWENLTKKIQVQAGYTIADVMQIKAQWIGDGADGGVVNAAVGLKAVEGMTLDAGVYIPVNSEVAANKDYKKFTVGLFWGMGFGSVNVNVNGQLKFAKDDTQTTEVKAGAGLGVDLGNGLSCGADVRYGQNFMKDANEDATLAFAAWLDKGIANGTLGVAFQGAMKTGIRDFAASDFTIAVPVRVQCFF